MDKKNKQLHSLTTIEAMNLDRTTQPPIKEIESFNLSKAPELKLGNGIPLYYLSTGGSDMIKVEWMFSAGNWYQNESLVAFAVINMLMEGSEHYSSVQIAEMVEYYGGFLSFHVDKDNAYVSLMCMRKYLKEILEIVEDMIKRPQFHDNELETFKNKHKQQFLVEQSKLKNIARVTQARMLFGETHPYGYVVEAVDFDKLTSSSLKKFHQERYCSNRCKIIASGKVERDEIALLEKHFGGKDWLKKEVADALIPDYQTESNKKVFIEKNDAVQSAVRIGKILVNKDHPDYAGLTVLNCVLGGYFGSRLMKEIREEKGYTYGINSLFITFKNAGYLTIVSELGTNVTREALSAIYAEIEKLVQEPVPEEELKRVKNYMLGEMLRMFDGPFAQAESLVSLLECDLPYEHYEEMIQTIKSLTAQDLLKLAGKYLKKGSFHEVVVGKME